MAMTTCKECGGEVSTKAASCPHCGAVLKKKRKGMGCGSLVILLFILGFIVIGYWGSQGPGSLTSPTIVDSSPETQVKRKALIEDLIKQGVWFKVEKPASLPHAYTGNVWNSLNIDDKKSFASATFAYYVAQDPTVNVMVIYDGRTGKRMGTFSALGLDLD